VQERVEQKVELHHMFMMNDYAHNVLAQVQLGLQTFQMSGGAGDETFMVGGIMGDLA
jgi:hypothetical protein